MSHAGPTRAMNTLIFQMSCLPQLALEPKPKKGALCAMSIKDFLSCRVVEQPMWRPKVGGATRVELRSISQRDFALENGIFFQDFS